MGHAGCEEFLWWFCERQERDPEFRARMLEIMRGPGDPKPAVARLIRDTDPSVAVVAEAELFELPPFAVNTILGAWLEATSRGISFIARGGTMQNPREFARERRVRVTVDEGQNAINVELLHIPGRHPLRA